MKVEFQAKDIQNILIIPKHRYEYLATKIGIKPDIDEVEGTGRSHLYSFKNLLQFAFVHQANKLGLTPKAAKKMLSHIDEFERSEKTGIYNSDKRLNLIIHYIDFMVIRFFIISDTKIIRKVFYPKDDQIFLKALYNAQKGPKPEYQKFLELFSDTFELRKEKSIQKVLSIASGYVTINLQTIKQTLLDQLNNYS